MKPTITRLARRGLSYIIDALLVFILVRVFHSATAVLGSVGLVWTLIFDVCGLLLTATYIVGSHWRSGRTIGKQITGLRVATIDGYSPPPFRHAFLRYAPLLAIAIVLLAFDWLAQDFRTVGVAAAFLWMIAEMIVALRTEGYRSIHDMIGGTVVTDERAKKA
jgi:uncharacterized RDD family membrane protein YckC